MTMWEFIVRKIFKEFLRQEKNREELERCLKRTDNRSKHTSSEDELQRRAV